MRSVSATTTLTASLLLSAFAAEAASGKILTLGEFQARICNGVANETGCRSTIEDFDRKLNHAFREAVRVAPNAPELRAQQRRWLTEVRDETSVLSYANAAVVSRILELQQIAIRGIGRLELPMKVSEQRRICEGIARAASRGELADMLLESRDMPDADLTPGESAVAKERVAKIGQEPRKLFTLPIRSGKPVPFADIFIGGTCFSAEIRAAADPLVLPSDIWPTEEIDPSEADDVIRWAYWGGWESVLMYGGRYLLVTRTSRDGPPGIVTWVTPFATLRPICSFELERVDRSVSVVREDAKLCSLAVRNELPPVSWRGVDYRDSKWTEEERKLLARPGALPGIEMTIVDIDNDGASDTLGRSHYDSGAGCGSSYSSLLLLSEDGVHVKMGSMNSALMEMGSRNSDPVQVFTYRSRQYVQARPQDALKLFRVTPDAVETECVFHDQPIARVKTLYPLDGPVRDPAKQQR